MDNSFDLKRVNYALLSKGLELLSIYYFSDIDLVVLGDWKQLPLFTLERALLEKGITNRANIKVLDKASVSSNM